MSRSSHWMFLCVLAAGLAACADESEPTGAAGSGDGATSDTGGGGSVPSDAGGQGGTDSGGPDDTGSAPDDTGSAPGDTSIPEPDGANPDDSSVDPGPDDSGVDPAPDDAVTTDTSPSDSGTTTAGVPCAVATILEDKCVSCHASTPLFGAPMPLVTLDHLQTGSLSRPSTSVGELSVQRAADDRNPMPPAPAARLTAAELETLSDWVAAGMPSGDACGTSDADAGTPGDTTPDTEVWDPECEWEVEYLANSGAGVDDATPFTVPKSANHYECFYFDPPADIDSHGLRFSSVIDDERVVHHWLLYAEQGSGTAGTRRGCSGSHSEATLIAGWAPGGDDWIMPPGVGMEMPTDTTYFVEIHYANPRNLTTTDRSGVRVCGTNTLQENSAATHWLGTENLLMLGAGNHSFTGTCTPNLTQPAHILRSWPHMHRNGTAMFSEIIRAGGARETLLDVPFSFDNQISHDTVFTINPGDRITTRCDYRTSDAFVTFGANTEQEMCYNFVIAWPAGSFDTGGGIRGGSDNFCLR